MHLKKIWLQYTCVHHTRLMSMYSFAGFCFHIRGLLFQLYHKLNSFLVFFKEFMAACTSLSVGSQSQLLYDTPTSLSRDKISSVRDFCTLCMGLAYSLFIRNGSTGFTGVTTVYNVHSFFYCCWWRHKKLEDTLSIGINWDLDLDWVLSLTSGNSLSEHDEICITSCSLLSNYFSICGESSVEIFKTSTVGEKDYLFPF